MLAYAVSLKMAWWRRFLPPLDVTWHRKRHKSLPQRLIELQARDAMPPSIVAGRWHDKCRKQSHATKKMLPKRSIAMENAHNFQFGIDGLPGESTVHYQP